MAVVVVLHKVAHYPDRIVAASSARITADQNTRYTTTKTVYILMADTRVRRDSHAEVSRIPLRR